MSQHQKVWGTERFLMGLALFIIMFLIVWSTVYYMNDDFLPKG